MVAIAALAALSSAAFAEDERARDTTATKSPTAETRITPKAFGGVSAPNVRLAALFDAGGAPIRTKGVESIQRIATGVYCIRPTASSGINVNTMIATVSPEYFYSDLDEVTVQWVAAASGCGTGRFGVYTFSDANFDGNYVLANTVGFSIVVP